MKKSLKDNLSQITKKDFLKYKQIKDAGVIPLYEVKNIIQATQLSSNMVLTIMDNYTSLCKSYEDGELE